MIPLKLVVKADRGPRHNSMYFQFLFSLGTFEFSRIVEKQTDDNGIVD